VKLRINLKTLSEITGGEIIKGDGATRFDSFETDTRKMKKGSFFWAFEGKHFDAHDFLTPEISEISKGWIIEKNSMKKLPVMPQNVLAVNDTVKSLHKLAAWHRSKFNIPLIAVTGSNGKTTTKEMIFSILSQKGDAYASKENFNNHYGLPLSILELNSSHKYAVFEMGASKKGDIKELGEIAKPTHAVITNISAAHLEFFKSLEVTFQTKIEIIDCLQENGVFAYNSDDDYLKSLSRWKGKKIRFGRKDADVEIAGENPLEIRFRKKERIRVSLNFVGKHNFENAAAAAAITFAASFSSAEIKRGLEQAKGLAGRMEKIQVGEMTVIFDAYNANPASMQAAFQYLENSGLPRPFYLVLGDMKELGAYSYLHHKNLGEKICVINPEYVYLAGSEIKPAYETLLTRRSVKNINYSEKGDWMDEVKRIIKTSKGTMLIKASRSMNFEKILEGLVK